MGNYFSRRKCVKVVILEPEPEPVHSPAHYLGTVDKSDDSIDLKYLENDYLLTWAHAQYTNRMVEYGFSDWLELAKDLECRETCMCRAVALYEKKVVCDSFLVWRKYMPRVL